MFWRLVALVLLVVVVVQLLILTVQGFIGLHKFFWLNELNLRERYGAGSWVIITGASSGQGRRFALEWASRGFNLILIGSVRTQGVIDEINANYPFAKVRFIAKNFAEAYQDGFFYEIERVVDEVGDVSVLVNSVGHRVGWMPFHEMPVEKIRDIIVTGTIVQARLIYMMLPRLLNRQLSTGRQCLIVSLTAQCIHPNFGFGSVVGNEISVPYLTIYEPTNAWGYFQMQSIIAEYGDQLDLLNITPGAVETVNTKEALADTLGVVDDVTFVRNIFKLMGNIQGETCAYWGHAASLFAVNFAPWLKSSILRATGEKIAQNYMRNLHSKSYNTAQKFV